MLLGESGREDGGHQDDRIIPAGHAPDWDAGARITGSENGPLRPDGHDRLSLPQRRSISARTFDSPG